MKTEFIKLGFFKEFWKDGKFIGTLKCEQDRDTFGYYGAKIETLSAAVVLDNKKKIKAGETVKTMIFPLCGRLEQEISETLNFTKHE